MTTKTYRNPKTNAIRVVDEKNEVQEAALLKLGWVEISGDDIANAPSLSVVYEKVQPATPPVEPPALPRLVTPVPSAPTRETDAPPQATPEAITGESAQPLTGGKGKNG